MVYPEAGQFNPAQAGGSKGADEGENAPSQEKTARPGTVIIASRAVSVASSSERGRNYTPLREVVHCALPGASCGQQMIFVSLLSSQGTLHFPCAGPASYPFVDLPPGTTLHCKLFPTIFARQVFRNPAILFQWDSV